MFNFNYVQLQPQLDQNIKKTNLVRQHLQKSTLLDDIYQKSV